MLNVYHAFYIYIWILLLLKSLIHYMLTSTLWGWGPQAGAQCAENTLTYYVSNNTTEDLNTPKEKKKT